MKSFVINLNDVVNGTFTNDEGAKLYAALAPHLAAGTQMNRTM